MPRTLRDYQKIAHKEIYAAWAQKKSPLLVMPTGAGKSFTIMALISAVSGVYSVVLAVRKRDLVEQLTADARSFGLDYGVYMAGHSEFDPTKNIQICSIDTLRSRKDYPLIDEKKVIVFIDEADESLSKSFCDFINAYRNNGALLGGMTATPYNGLYHFDCIVSPITAKELNRQKILVDYRYVIPDEGIDTKEIDIVGGEYKKDQIKKETNKKKSIANAITAWDLNGEQRITLGFASNVMQSKSIVKRFNEYYGGVIAKHCDADTPKIERKKLINELRTGKIKILMNVGLFLRGTDIPEIGCILDAAPTLRMNRHVQKWGRGSRKNPIYSDCLVIDLTDNWVNLGPFYLDRSALINLEKPLRFTRGDLDCIELMRRCEKCFGAFEPKEFINNICPRCGTVSKKVRKIKEEKDTKFTEISEDMIIQRMMINEYKKEFWKHMNLPFYKKKYGGNKKDVSRAIHLKMHEKWGTAKMIAVKNAIYIDRNMIRIWMQDEYY